MIVSPYWYRGYSSQADTEGELSTPGGAGGAGPSVPPQPAIYPWMRETKSSRSQSFSSHQSSATNYPQAASTSSDKSDTQTGRVILNYETLLLTIENF